MLEYKSHKSISLILKAVPRFLTEPFSLRCILKSIPTLPVLKAFIKFRGIKLKNNLMFKPVINIKKIRAVNFFNYRCLFQNLSQFMLQDLMIYRGYFDLAYQK